MGDIKSNGTLRGQTADHFMAWLTDNIPIEDQHGTEQGIYRLLALDPTLIERGWSWREMDHQARRNWPAMYDEDSS
jgi:hypothetical protein